MLARHAADRGAGRVTRSLPGGPNAPTAGSRTGRSARAHLSSAGLPGRYRVGNDRRDSARSVGRLATSHHAQRVHVGGGLEPELRSGTLPNWNAARIGTIKRAVVG